ncbi:Homeobox protein [Hirschfeldia incana]|nr:Homeobox protein [Hirschfeldia incana]
MHSANRRRTRSSGSGLDHTNPQVDKVTVQSNASSVPLQTPEGNGISNRVSGEESKSAPVTGKKRSSGSHRELVLGVPCRGQFEMHRSSKKLGGGESNVVVSSQAMRSKEAAGSSSSVDVNAKPTPVDGSKERKECMNKSEVREDDEYTRIKKKLRYFLNRINYEQNLIDAYSLEGWKGSSVEKLRPEKELERAKKEILKRKVKIRELFQHLDTLCAEGSLPESLFDSGGEISSEDIFCAKCGSKELPIDNDIILCDGFCDRGFHQYCVEPPLRKEDIPPDDESWLCPGCDCKDYSFDMLNESLGTKLSVSDSWEKVFPEAAAAMAGGDQTLDCDLPSDDSEDEEYDPDGLNDNANDEDGSDDDSDDSENEDGSCDESDCTSASDEMVKSFKEANDIMGYPSDDSEDDDYDPDAPVPDEDKMQGSSDSDNTSDSEDLEASFKGDESNHQDEVTPRGKPGRKKSQLPDVSISESDTGIDDDGIVDVPGRRKVERLDYKKLYDDEYENVPTSSSDDEDWDKTAGKEDFDSEEEGDTVPLKQPSKAEDHTSTKKPRQESKRESKKDTVKAPQEVHRENGCSGEKSSSAVNKRTNPRTQRLFQSFQENRYPDITTRENLAKELQMTVKQVSSWFNNTRFSTSKRMASSKEGVEKLRTGERETSVTGSSEQTMETNSAVENQSGASELTTGSRKRRRR